MMIFKHLLSNLNWWIFFTKDVAPSVFPMLVPEVQTLVKNRFRTCFTKKTGVGFEGKINTEQLIQKLKLYKGHESNITLLVNLTEKCSENATYQSQFSRCMTGSIVKTCIRKYVAQHYNRWANMFSSTKNNTKTGEAVSNGVDEKEESEDYQLPNKKAEDLENDQLTNEIVSNEIADDDDGDNKRMGKSAGDDDDDDDDEVDSKDKEDEESDKNVGDAKDKRINRMKAWMERLTGMRKKMKDRKSQGNVTNILAFKMQCEPCFDLKSSDELKTVFTQCWKNTDKASYMMKIKNCINANRHQTDSEVKKQIEEIKARFISKMLDGYWIKLFKPTTTKTSLFFTQEFWTEKQNCMMNKLGLGTVDKVDKKGYTQLISSHLVGEDKVKEVLINTVDKCGGANPEGKVSFAKFAECTLPMLETACGQ